MVSVFILAGVHLRECVPVKYAVALPDRLHHRCTFLPCRRPVASEHASCKRFKPFLYCHLQVLALLEALVTFISSNEGSFLKTIMSSDDMAQGLRDKSAPESFITAFTVRMRDTLLPLELSGTFPSHRMKRMSNCIREAAGRSESRPAGSDPDRRRGARS